MTITMNDDGISDVGQLGEIVRSNSPMRSSGKGRAEMYAWIEATLARFRYHGELKKNKGTGKAKVATARKLCTIIFAILTDKQPFREFAPVKQR